MENKVFCEDCRYKDEWNGHLAQCKHEQNWYKPIQANHVNRVKGGYAKFCTRANPTGDCSLFEQKKTILVQIKEFFRGRT